MVKIILLEIVIYKMGKYFDRKIFKSTICMFVFILLVFFATQSGASSSTMGLFVRKAITFGIAAYVAQKVIGRSWFNEKWRGIHIITALWIAYIIFKKVCFYKSDCLFANEIFIAFYSSLGMMLLEHVRSMVFPGNKLLMILSDIPKLILTIIPAISVIHWMLYGSDILIEEVLAVRGTEWREAVEWVEMYVGTGMFFLIIGFFVLEMLFFVAIRRGKHEISMQGYGKGHIALALILCIGAFFYPVQLIKASDWTGKYFESVTYTESLKLYNANIDEKVKNIDFSQQGMISDKPHTVVIFIGESACRDKLKAFNDNCAFEDTPWMSGHKDDPEFTFFNNGYAAQSLTQQVLALALTEKSAYNEIPLLEAMNFVDVAKAKGYKTYWITNLGNNEKTAFYSLLSTRSDEVIREGAAYDDNMLKALDSINPNENNLLIFHGNGSHGQYSTRYPEDRAVFKGGTVEDEYANSVLFTDNLLENVYKYCSENLNLQVMLYFSDHGENLHTGHGPADQDFVKVRIPVMLYTSKEYGERNPDVINALKSHQDTYFTNDMIYNTICGLLREKSNFYDSREDLASSDYNFKLQDLLTFGGKAKVADDPMIK